MTIEQYYIVCGADLIEFPGDENEGLWLERTETGAYEVNYYYGSHKVPAIADVDEVRDDWLRGVLDDCRKYTVDRGCSPWIVVRSDALDGGSFQEHHPNERKVR